MNSPRGAGPGRPRHDEHLSACGPEQRLHPTVPFSGALEAAPGFAILNICSK
jgi:hypothetical protein